MEIVDAYPGVVGVSGCVFAGGGFAAYTFLIMKKYEARIAALEIMAKMFNGGKNENNMAPYSRYRTQRSRRYIDPIIKS